MGIELNPKEPTSLAKRSEPNSQTSRTEQNFMQWVRFTSLRQSYTLDLQPYRSLQPILLLSLTMSRTFSRFSRNNSIREISMHFCRWRELSFGEIEAHRCLDVCNWCLASLIDEQRIRQYVLYIYTLYPRTIASRCGTQAMAWSGTYWHLFLNTICPL